MTIEEKIKLLNLPNNEWDISIKFKNEPLYALYEVKASDDTWHKNVVYIDEFEQYDNLIQGCKCFADTMNLIGFRVDDDIHRRRKIVALKQMKYALDDFKENWQILVEIFHSHYIDANDYILGTENEFDEYPFNKSFDELNIDSWVDGCIDKIDAELKQLKACK